MNCIGYSIVLKNSLGRVGFLVGGCSQELVLFLDNFIFENVSLFQFELLHLGANFAFLISIGFLAHLLFFRPIKCWVLLLFFISIKYWVRLLFSKPIKSQALLLFFILQLIFFQEQLILQFNSFLLLFFLLHLRLNHAKLVWIFFIILLFLPQLFQVFLASLLKSFFSFQFPLIL